MTEAAMLSFDVRKNVQFFQFTKQNTKKVVGIYLIYNLLFTLLRWGGGEYTNIIFCTYFLN